VGHDREHEVRGGGDRARRGRKAHAAGDERLGLLLAPIPAHDRVTRGHEPRDDAGAHRAQPDETDGHSSTSHGPPHDDDAEREERLDRETTSVGVTLDGARAGHANSNVGSLIVYSTTILT